MSHPLSLDLWVRGSLGWFFQTRLAAPAEEPLPAQWVQALAAQLHSTPANLAARLQQLSLAELDLPVSLQRLVAAGELSKAQLWVLAFCDALNNHYELNIALQQLQGAQPQSWPRLYVLCDLVEAICGAGLTPTQLARWSWVDTGVLQLQTQGPLALSWVQLNGHYWQALQNPQELALFVTPARATANPSAPAPLAAIAGSFPPAGLDTSTSADRETIARFALAIRLGELQALHLCGTRRAGLIWAQQLAVCLNKTLVVPVPESSPAVVHLLCIAHELLPLTLAPDAKTLPAASHTAGIAREDDSPPAHSPPLAPLLVLHTSPLGIAELTRLQQQVAVAIHYLPASAWDERKSAWQDWVSPAQAGEFARRWLIAADAIHPLAATVPAGIWQKTTDELCAALARARRQLAPPHLQNLAFLVPQQITRDALVLSPKIHGELAALQARCEQREQVFDALGPALAGAGHGGVRALLYGESGTGKTLAALYLASQLGAPLYRLDLGAVLNKYVGETEKNIHQAMLEAAEGDFILLIDEADALFAKRGDGDSGGERFANMLTNYLLARIEQHPGIVLMTTNGLGRIDSAFMRRFDRVIEFHAPNLEERVRLWQNHLGARSPGEQACKQLASLCELSGGFIRNAVLAAAAELPSHQQPRLTFAVLLQAIAREYRKSGKPLPPKLLNQLNPAQPDKAVQL